ncbi:MAG TPA: YihY/virulence factor BrkB family protein [Flavobacteriales bacterium]|nr:YihY/virulence factor BrkB family protein [Flavobacteriales bacterium]HIK67075.1 YihY/virulence factor BrkB family protein [Flavobacteriales bacterium]
MSNNITKWIESSAIVKRTQFFLRSISPWGVEGMNLYDVFRFFGLGLINGSVSIRAASISYRLLLAFFPAMILLLSILPHTPLETNDVMDALLLFFPGETVSLFELTVNDLLEKSHVSILSIGFILTVIYASSSVNAILTGFNASYLLEKKGNPMLYYFISLLLLVILVVMLGVAVLLIGFSGQGLTWLSNKDLLPGELLPWLNIARWTMSLILVYFSVSILYHFGNPDRDKWRTITPGATMTTILIVLLSLGFGAFITYLDSYNRLYGSLGTFLLLLVWVNANSSILLLGFEFNVSVHKARNEARSNLQ